MPKRPTKQQQQGYSWAVYHIKGISAAKIQIGHRGRVSFYCTKVQSTGTDAVFYAEYCDFASARLEIDAS